MEKRPDTPNALKPKEIDCPSTTIPLPESHLIDGGRLPSFLLKGISTRF
jgi:hypothetical protein